MGGLRAAALLHTPVLVRGIRLGEVEDVLLDGEEPRILGLDVLCGDGVNRFVPFSAAFVTPDAIRVETTLTLLEPPELEFYRGRSRRLAAVPELADAVVGREGVLAVPLAARC
jgi:PRC-barrel domain